MTSRLPRLDAREATPQVDLREVARRAHGLRGDDLDAHVYGVARAHASVWPSLSDAQRVALVSAT